MSSERENVNNYLRLIDTIDQLQEIIRIDDLFSDGKTERANKARKALTALIDVISDFRDEAIEEIESEARCTIEQIHYLDEV